MALIERSYRDPADIDAMRRLLIEGARDRVVASYMHPGCLDWYTHYPPDEAANRRNLRVWERDESGAARLDAFGICLPHEGSCDLFVSAAVYGTDEHDEIMGMFVKWATERAREQNWTSFYPFWAFDHDYMLRRLFKAYGYRAHEGVPPPLFEHRLHELPDVAVPEGFTVQGVHDLDDGRLRASVTYAAFRSTEDWNAYWANYAGFIGSAVYDGERDLLVRSPDGRGVAACTIWFDPVNQIGLFEPVATHPDFQGRGFGKIVMAEGLRRMKAAGMQRAILGFDPANAPARALYTSMGFAAAKFFMVYSKPVG